ncbi:FG-GAP-like repeat-containing protein [Granulicella rosea]|uniref:FG-GAP-like repeat-containing protein n=1 Tax=Granulicella rosea TaxID=474952 RepID=UPI001595C0A7|nr:FG-GAP-like repeat-containing protein [Granulicella rosea]
MYASKPKASALQTLQGRGSGMALPRDAKATTAFPGFYLGPNVPVAGITDAVAVVDVDGANGKDLVVVQLDGTLDVFYNDGKGNFPTSSSVGTENGIAAQTQTIQVIDLNGDGKPDVVAMDPIYQSFFVYMNTGNGTFAPGKYTAILPASIGLHNRAADAIVVGDVNGDNHPDVVLLVSAQNADTTTTTIKQLTYFGNGDGTFQAPIEADTVMPGYYFVGTDGSCALLADMDGDSKPDLVMELVKLGETITISTAHGNGDGTFGKIPTTGASVNDVYEGNGTLRLADLNKDGRPDAIFLTSSNNVYSALGNGDGSFQTPRVALNYLAEGTGSVALTDLNNDGILDMVLFDSMATGIFPGLGDGTFGQVSLGYYANGPSSSAEPDPVDIDGDGVVDIAYLDTNANVVSLLHGNVDGTFIAAKALYPVNSAAAHPNNTEYPNNILAVTSGDVNGDGKTELIAFDFTDAATNGVAETVTAASDAQGRFSFVKGLTAAQEMASGIAGFFPMTADFNGDGRADLIGESSLGEILVGLANADGSFQTPVKTALPAGITLQCGYLNAIDVGDVNGDGKLDIVATYYGDSNCFAASVVTPSGYFVYLGDGSGKFKGAFTPFGEGLYSPRLIDLNNDGRLDLVVSDVPLLLDQTGAHILPGLGDGAFDLAHATLAGAGYIIADVLKGDYNGDGKQDLTLIQNGKTDYECHTDGSCDYEVLDGSAGILLMAGHGDFTFDAAVGIPGVAGATAGTAAYADFNADGLPDIAFSSYGSSFSLVPSSDAATATFGTVVLPNLGGGSFGAPLSMPAPGDTFGAQNPLTFVGDFNGDGASDIAVGGGVDIGGHSMASAYYLNRGGIGLSLSAAPTTVTQNSPVILTATLASPLLDTPVATGTVSFFANGSSIGSAAIVNNVAVLSVSTLAIGAEKITATYAGDAAHNGASAAPLSVTIVSPPAGSFNLSSSTGGITLARGAAGSITLTLSSNSTFSGTVALTCAGLPANASCSINPSSVSLGANGTSTVVATINAMPSQAEKGSHPFGWPAGTGVAVAGVLLVGIRARRSRKQAWMMLTMLAVLLGSAASLTGCGGGGGNNGPALPAAGTYTVTVTASGTSTSGVAITRSLPLTVAISQ